MQQPMPPSFLQTLTAPVFSLCRLRTESHQTPVGIKLAAMRCDRPGGFCHPRETLVPSRVQGVACIPCGYRRDGDASPLMARGLGDPGICIHFRWRKGGVQIIQLGSHQSAFLARRPLANPLAETSAHIEGLLVAQHVIAGPCQLVRQSLDRQDAIGLALFAIIKALGLRTVT